MAKKPSPSRKSASPRRRNAKRNQSTKTQYLPVNPAKYKGTYPINLRSKWEIAYARSLDHNPAVLEWSSEPVAIPYHDPLTNTQKVYVPDFLIKVVKRALRNGRLVQVIENVLIEIKPSHETFIKEARSKADAAAVEKNTAKWAAAAAWCSRRNIKFRILTEKDLFRGVSKAKVSLT